MKFDRFLLFLILLAVVSFGAGIFADEAYLEIQKRNRCPSTEHAWNVPGVGTVDSLNCY